MRVRLPWRRAPLLATHPSPEGHDPIALADGTGVDPDEAERILAGAATIEEICVVGRRAASGAAELCVVAVPAAALVLRCSDDPAALETAVRDEVERLGGGLVPRVQPARVYLHPVPLPRTTVGHRRRLVGEWLDTLERTERASIAAAAEEDERERGAGASGPPVAPGQADVTFRREGEYWTIVYAGAVCRLKDSRGLHYIAHLLRHPGREFHALDLTAAVGGGPGRGDSGQRDTGPLLDTAAKDAYRRRLDELREELGEAERFNDAGHAARAREEIEALTEQLAGAVGLGGRDRVAAADAERARVAVTQGIKTAVRRVADGIPALGDHLSRSIKTGTFCVYAPDPSRPLTWEL